MWLYIAGFCYEEYLPKLEVVTTQAGVDELGLQCGAEHIQNEAAISYMNEVKKLKENWGYSCLK